jgi:hypothetical protein
MKLFSNSTRGFYDIEIHGENIPADAVEITDAQYKSLMDGQQAGKEIGADLSGKPVLVDPVPPTRDEIALAVSNARAVSYAKESDPLFFKAQRGESTMDEWLAKVTEIKARIPDGVMPF